MCANAAMSSRRGAFALRVWFAISAHKIDRQTPCVVTSWCKRTLGAAQDLGASRPRGLFLCCMCEGGVENIAVLSVYTYLHGR